MASILLQFSPPPRRSYLSVFEQDGQMKDAPESLPISCVPDYPEVAVQCEHINRENARCESAQMAFLSHDQGPWKQALHSWQSGGFLEMFQELSNSQDGVPGIVSSVCRHAVNVLEKLFTIKASMYPAASMSSTDLLSKYTHVSNWSKSPVQALTWHPHVPKLAVALRDNSVHVYSSGSNLNPVLKHRLQKQVASLAWQPLSSSVLAVACHSCVLIWHVEPTSLAVRPSSSSVQVLQYNSQGPVTSLVWAPSGDKLVSASPRNSFIVVWDVPKEQGTALRWDKGGGVPLMAYSPDGSKLFTANISPLFRIWETQRWNWEIWSQLSGRCKAACWSPDGSVLIFAMERDTALYAIRFTANDDQKEDHLSAVGHSVVLADLSQVSVSAGSEADIRAGGEVHSMVWDETGERLAVMFEANELGNNHLVAVFKVTVHPMLELLPGGFIKGRSGESAHLIAFAPNFQNGALLTVVWSSGRVGYVPMYFIPSDKIQQQQHQHHQQFDSRPWSSPTPLMSPRGRI